jgi:3-isopropylmalate/(R)-2-methylmalate dehydratase small subunit
MVLTGYARRVGQALDPALIIAPEYAAGGDPAILAAHCLEAVDPMLAETVREGDILVIGAPLAGSPANEAAVIALQALGIAAVICTAADTGFADIAGTYGLPVLIQAAAAQAIPAGALLRIDIARGNIEVPGGAGWQSDPCAEPVIAATQRAQLLIRMRRVVEDEGFAE